MTGSKTKVTLLVGLPGSGKTHLGNELAKVGARFIDDVSRFDKLPPIEGEHVVIADAFLCNPAIKKKAEERLSNAGFELEWIYFENNPAACRENVKRRNDGRKVNELITQLSKLYEVGRGEVRSVFEID